MQCRERRNITNWVIVRYSRRKKFCFCFSHWPSCFPVLQFLTVWDSLKPVQEFFRSSFSLPRESWVELSWGICRKSAFTGCRHRIFTCVVLVIGSDVEPELRYVQEHYLVFRDVLFLFSSRQFGFFGGKHSENISKVINDFTFVYFYFNYGRWFR